MSFSSAIKKETIGFGGQRIIQGTWTSGSTTGGDITTGLLTVETITLTPKGSSVTTNGVVVNETLPLANAGGLVTIVTDSGVDGYWEAKGI
jgi:hypothetical protein